jgi:hypothetical protein
LTREPSGTLFSSNYGLLHHICNPARNFDFWMSGSD